MDKLQFCYDEHLSSGFCFGYATMWGSSCFSYNVYGGYNVGYLWLWLAGLVSSCIFVYANILLVVPALVFHFLSYSSCIEYIDWLGSICKHCYFCALLLGLEEYFLYLMYLVFQIFTIF